MCGSESSRPPGTERIYIKTWGCSHNNSDGEYMAGMLASYGYAVRIHCLFLLRSTHRTRMLVYIAAPAFADADESDLWILNSCTVKTPSGMQR